MIYVVSLLLLVSLYVNWNLFRKNEVLEEANEEAIDWTASVRSSLLQILANITNIDQKKMFEKDDEVGTMFSMIKDEIKKLENAFDKEQK
tara:strand:+ start:164 stop:433 length:270 start_codon:yes stop_codon:yes gene_type:complete